MKLPLLGALLLVLHNLQLDELDGTRSHNTPPCMGFKPRKFALEVLSRLTQRGGSFQGGTHDFRTLPFSTDPAELVHPPYSFTARFVFLAFALLHKQGGGNQVTFR